MTLYSDINRFKIALISVKPSDNAGDGRWKGCVPSLSEKCSEHDPGDPTRGAKCAV